jgi:hypothetical protein
MKLFSLGITGANGVMHDSIDLHHTKDGLRLNNHPITAPEARQLWDTVSKALHQDEDNERLKRNVGAVLDGGAR